MWRMALVSAAIGCGPAVGVPAGTESDDGGSGDPGSTTDTTSSTSGSSTGTVPGDPTDVKIDVFASGGEACTETKEVERLRTTVVVLVDVSQTMATQTVDHDDDPDTPEVTRWAMLTSALQDHLPLITPLADVGIQSFPRPNVPAPPDPDACATEIDGVTPGATDAELLAYLPAPDAEWFLGASPMRYGIEAAYAQFPDDPGVDRRLLLLTDSAANCRSGQSPPALFDDFDDEIPNMAENLRDLGIVVHVIGVDVPFGTTGGEGDAITDHRARLQQIAYFGAPEVFVDNAAELDAALADFLLEAHGCRLRIPAEFLDDWPEVTLGTEVVEPIDPAACNEGVDGYRSIYTRTHDIIEFCGTACDAFRIFGTATLTSSCDFAE